MNQSLFLAVAFVEIICVAGCLKFGGTSDLYRVQVRCLANDDRPVAGVELDSDDQSVVSDEQGIAQFSVAGNEGTDVVFRIAKIPTGFEIGDRQAERHVYLKNLGKASGAINYDLRLRKKRETYVVMVSADQATDLDVLANGAPVARLNSRGAAAFRLEAEPRSELKVILDTKGNPRASEQNPVHPFILPENSAILTHRYKLVITPPPPPRPVSSKKGSKQTSW